MSQTMQVSQTAVRPAWREALLKVVRERPGMSLEEMALQLHTSPIIAHQRATQLIGEGWLRRDRENGLHPGPRMAGGAVRRTPDDGSGRVATASGQGRMYAQRLLVAIARRFPGVCRYAYTGVGQVEISCGTQCRVALCWSSRSVLGVVRTMTGRSCQFAVEADAHWQPTLELVLNHIDRAVREPVELQPAM